MKHQHDGIPVVSGYFRGTADVKLKESETLDTVCGNIIPNYNIERYEAIAIRVYFGKESIMTVYAIDKMHKSSVSSNESKLPVKKFKLEMPAEKIIQLFSNVNLTIIKGNHQIDEIDVLNK